MLKRYRSVITTVVGLALILAAVSPSLAATTLIHAGHLVDPADGSVRVSIDVLVEGDRIVKVGS